MAYPSSNGIVVEVHECLGHFLLVGAISIKFSWVQEVLSKRNPIGDIVTTWAPLPSLYCDETISWRVATTLTTKVTVGAGWSDLVNSDGWGESVCKCCLFVHCEEGEGGRGRGREREREREREISETRSLGDHAIYSINLCSLALEALTSICIYINAFQ